MGKKPVDEQPLEKSPEQLRAELEMGLGGEDRTEGQPGIRVRPPAKPDRQVLDELECGDPDGNLRPADETLFRVPSIKPRPTSHVTATKGDVYTGDPDDSRQHVEAERGAPVKGGGGRGNPR
jgi:hypothetical protein